MKKLGKIAGIFVVVLLLAAGQVFSLDQDLLNDNFNKIQNALTDYANELSLSLPFNSTVGLNWSDAYIGQLLELPPHFGFGVTVGFTPFDMNAMGSFFEAIGYDNPLSILSDYLNMGGKELATMVGSPLPAYTFDARLGGFGIPFDIGLKIGVLDSNELLKMDLIKNTPELNGMTDIFNNIHLDYLLIGGDFRYGILNGESFPIKLSVGVGYNHMSTSFRIKTEIPAFEYNTLAGKISMDTPELFLSMNTNLIEAKAQVSFPLFIITPYAGIGAGYSWTNVSFGLDGTNLNASEAVKAFLADEYGITDVDKDGFSTTIEKSDFLLRAFGGLSLDLFVFRIDLGLNLNLTNLLKGGDVAKNSLGASVGLRFQL